MELVRRLDTGLADVFPDQDERLRHILTSQVFEMSHNEILHRITIEAVSGGVPERKAWIEDSGHFRVGDLARMTPEERQKMVDEHADGRALTMSKKFDVVIGNPPYQEEAQGGGTRDTPVYHLFMDAAYEVGKKAVLITPARFLFNAGFTPKAWNTKMLADPHLTVPHYVPNSDELFPGTIINGGIAVTYRDEDRDGEPIGTFTHYPELNTILHKVVESDIDSMESEITSSRSYRYTDEAVRRQPRGPRAATGRQRSAGQHQRVRAVLVPLPRRATRRRPVEYVRVLGLDGKKRTSPLDS